MCIYTIWGIVLESLIMYCVTDDSNLGFRICRVRSIIALRTLKMCSFEYRWKWSHTSTLWIIHISFLDYNQIHWIILQEMQTKLTIQFIIKSDTHLSPLDPRGRSDWVEKALLVMLATLSISLSPKSPITSLSGDSEWGILLILWSAEDMVLCKGRSLSLRPL